MEWLKPELKKKKNSEAKSRLESAWEQILDEVRELSYEPYIDDQIEISNVYEICEELINSDILKDESWDLRKEIIKDFVQNHYYNEYSVDEPIEELVSAMCTTQAEELEYADILLNTGYSYLAFDGAKIYKKYGQPDRYYKLLEERLGDDYREYQELIDYYKDVDPDKACQIAEIGLKKCYRHRTEFLIFIIHHAKDTGDEEKYFKLLDNVTRRSYVDVNRIYEEFGVSSIWLREMRRSRKT